jgi:hypothetical protein
MNVNKTTVYLPEDLKHRIEQAAQRDGISEAEVIRRSLDSSLPRPAPRGGLFRSSEPFAERVDELLVGFGQQR